MKMNQSVSARSTTVQPTREAGQTEASRRRRAAGALLALLAMLGPVPLARATVLSMASWDHSVNLSAGGGTLTPISGSGSLVPSTGLPAAFVNGLSLASSASEQYGLQNNASLTKGSVSFWYQVPSDLPTYGYRVMSITTSLGVNARVVDIYATNTGKFIDYSNGTGGAVYTETTVGSYSAGDWLHFTFQYDFSGPSSQIALWIGDRTRGDTQATGTTASLGAPITFGGSLTGGDAGIWINKLGGNDSAGVNGIWDDLYITDAPLYSFSQETIPMLDGPLAVPEPSTMILFGIGAGLLWLRQRRSQRSA